MDDKPVKVEITLSPELYAIAQGAGDPSGLIDAALTLFISTSQFYDYLYINKHKIAAQKKARYVQELAERMSLLDRSKGIK